ncbi:MAG TPA: EVE domain-containing protein [Thermoanaerobaculia bacterium]
MRYFVNTVSRDHVQAGAAGGFTQADHGRETRLKRLAKGDALVFYSPRVGFTAIAEVVDETPYQEEGSEQWRRRAKFATASETPIAPLLEQLEFIRNKQAWGVVFRRGFFEIGESDFRKIAAAMGVGSVSS